jgi:hypothetical protein
MQHGHNTAIPLPFSKAKARQREPGIINRQLSELELF